MGSVFAFEVGNQEMGPVGRFKSLWEPVAQAPKLSVKKRLSVMVESVGVVMQGLVILLLQDPKALVLWIASVNHMKNAPEGNASVLLRCASCFSSQQSLDRAMFIICTLSGRLQKLEQCLLGQ